jgi:hypothetical protein
VREVIETRAGNIVRKGRDPQRFGRRMRRCRTRRLGAVGSDVLRDVLPTFINEMTSSDAALVLVLDDYHLVNSEQVHASVTTLLDRCPSQLHLVLITRADPPLQQSRLAFLLRGHMFAGIVGSELMVRIG